MWLPRVLALATVGTQIAYPLTGGDARDGLTIAIVFLFAAFSLTHAAVHAGLAPAVALLLVAGGLGFAADVVGVQTGYPFGDYGYAQSLGPRLADVPVVIALAWTMMAYPALLVARELVRHRAAVVVVAAWALASWDTFLDPMMVDEGHWRWSDVSHSLPGADDVPVSNYIGWLVVSLLIMAVLRRVVPQQVDDALPTAMYLWVYASSVLANALFFDRAGVALLGGVAMGLVALPLAASLRRPAVRP